MYSFLKLETIYDFTWIASKFFIKEIFLIGQHLSLYIYHIFNRHLYLSFIVRRNHNDIFQKRAMWLIVGGIRNFVFNFQMQSGFSLLLKGLYSKTLCQNFPIGMLCIEIRAAGMVCAALANGISLFHCKAIWF